MVLHVIHCLYLVIFLLLMLADAFVAAAAKQTILGLYNVAF